jgi:hypothetical protein
MSRTKKIIFALSSIAFITQCALLKPGSASGYKDYKLLGKDYINFVFKTDTVAFAQLSNQKMWLKMIECSKRNGDSSSASIEQLVKNDYSSFFRKSYSRSFKYLKNEFELNSIQSFKVDSMRLEGILNPKDCICKEISQKNLKIFISTAMGSFCTRIGIVYFNRRWYLLEAIFPKLVKI